MVLGRHIKGVAFFRLVRPSNPFARKDADNLLKMRLKEEIGFDEYKALKADYEAKITASKKALDETDDRATTWMRKAERTFNLAHEIVDIFENGTLEEKRDVLGELGSNLTLSGKKLSVFNDTPFQILLSGLAEAKSKDARFEPKTIQDTSDENETFVSVRPNLARQTGRLANGGRRRFWPLIGKELSLRRSLR